MIISSLKVIREYFSKEKVFFVSIFIIFSVSIVFWWQFFGPGEIVSDAAQYNEAAISLLENNSYSLDGKLTMFREPGYSFFIFLVYKVFGVIPTAVKYLQVVLYFGSVLLVYFLAKKIFSNFTAKISALMVAVFPIYAIMANRILSEILALFLALVFLAVFSKAQASGRFVFYALAGFLLGCFLMVKSAFVLFLALSVIFIFWFCLKEDGWKKAILKAFLFFVSAVIIITPWVYRNYSNFGSLSIASRGGLLLYIRAIKTTYNFEQISNYSISSFTGEYFVRRFRDVNYNFEQEGQGLTFVRKFKAEEIKKNGNEDSDALDVALRQEAVSIIKNNPVKFLLYGIFELNNLNSPIIYQDRHFSIFHDNVYDFTFLKSSAIILLRILWYAFLLIALAGAAGAIRGGKKESYVFILFILAINAALFFLQGYPRSLLPIFPAYFMFFVYGLSIILDKLSFCNYEN